MKLSTKLASALVLLGEMHMLSTEETGTSIKELYRIVSSN